MRWRSLFGDLEGQLAAAEVRQGLRDVPDLTRAERAGISLVDRLRAHDDRGLRLTLSDGEHLGGLVSDVGPHWLLLADGSREHLVPLSAIAAIAGLGDRAAPPSGAISRLSLGHALRAIARDRSVVTVRSRGGTVVGRLQNVGSDHVDVAVARADSGRPTGESQSVPWSALLVVSRL